MVNWRYKWYIQIGGTNWPIKWPVQRHPCETDGTFGSGGGFKSVGGFLTQGFPLPAFQEVSSIRLRPKHPPPSEADSNWRSSSTVWCSAPCNMDLLMTSINTTQNETWLRSIRGCCLIEAVPVCLLVRLACLLGPHPQFTVNTLLKEFESRHPNSFIFQHSSTFLLAFLLFKASCNVKTVSARPARIRWANSTTSTGDHASVEPTVN